MRGCLVSQDPVEREPPHTYSNTVWVGNVPHAFRGPRGVAACRCVQASNTQSPTHPLPRPVLPPPSRCLSPTVCVFSPVPPTRVSIRFRKFCGRCKVVALSARLNVHTPPSVLSCSRCQKADKQGSHIARWFLLIESPCFRARVRRRPLRECCASTTLLACCSEGANPVGFASACVWRCRAPHHPLPPRCDTTTPLLPTLLFPLPAAQKTRGMR